MKMMFFTLNANCEYYRNPFADMRRQLESKSSQFKNVEAHLNELKTEEARKEMQLVHLQLLLRETKEQHIAKLKAVEAKYEALMEYDNFQKRHILELESKLETVMKSNTSHR